MKCHFFVPFKGCRLDCRGEANHILPFLQGAETLSCPAVIIMDFFL